METLLKDTQEVSFQQIKKVMSRRICQLINNTGEKTCSKKIIRLEILCADVDCLGWLNRQLNETKIYWSGRDGEFETAGVGITDLLKATHTVDYEELFSALRLGVSASDKYLRYYGGMSFYNKESGKEWEAFGNYSFVVPQFEIFNVEGKTFFAFNIKAENLNLSGINAGLSELGKLIFSDEQLDDTLPRMCSLRHAPDRPHWERIFDKNIRLSGKMAFDKIVLARKTSIDFEREINPLVLLPQLKELTNGCFHYYFQPAAGTAFLGATPERLFMRKGSRVESEALAGTKPRGKSESEDALYQQELFYSAKEALEHRYVAELVRNTLSKFCLSLRFDESSSILKVAGAQHLITRFQGVLRKGTRDAQLLSALHPTPAVGGCPLNKALKAISKIEPFGRGWYAGPVGFVGYEHVDFAVALRCALVQGRNVSLFAGAGIVEGSTPEGEWQEIENKNSAYMRVFGERK